MSLTIARVNALPETLAASTLYLVKSGTELVITVTGNTGAVVATTVSKADVNNAISAAIGGLDMSNSVEFAADIAARDTLAASLTKSAFVYVQDATDDETVEAGAAMYLYNFAAETFYKVTEYESLDLVQSWSNLIGKPDSTPAQIDAAVAATHTHANKAVLDALSDDAGVLKYNGALIGNVVNVGNEW